MMWMITVKDKESDALKNGIVNGGNTDCIDFPSMRKKDVTLIIQNKFMSSEETYCKFSIKECSDNILICTFLNIWNNDRELNLIQNILLNITKINVVLLAETTAGVGGYDFFRDRCNNSSNPKDFFIRLFSLKESCDYHIIALSCFGFYLHQYRYMLTRGSILITLTDYTSNTIYYSIIFKYILKMKKFSFTEILIEYLTYNYDGETPVIFVSYFCNIYITKSLVSYVKSKYEKDYMFFLHTQYTIELDKLKILESFKKYYDYGTFNDYQILQGIEEVFKHFSEAYKFSCNNDDKSNTNKKVKSYKYATPYLLDRDLSFINNNEELRLYILKLYKYYPYENQFCCIGFMYNLKSRFTLELILYLQKDSNFITCLLRR